MHENRHTHCFRRDSEVRTSNGPARSMPTCSNAREGGRLDCCNLPSQRKIPSSPRKSWRYARISCDVMLWPDVAEIPDSSGM
ncbi:hypothetical protein GCK32_003056 [Trichostrongylus colubriformis]|uniref:Uncharacterized protein n=1 Tax=Trichostrongylus colubriformis TaxID=6319 RepID=A0AAN8G6I3_TRICO